MNDSKIKVLLVEPVSYTHLDVYKRQLIDIEPDWVHLDTDENGIKMNSYFVQHPEMILGEMKMVSGRFGMEATCLLYT